MASFLVGACCLLAVVSAQDDVSALIQAGVLVKQPVRDAFAEDQGWADSDTEVDPLDPVDRVLSEGEEERAQEIPLEEKVAVDEVVEAQEEEERDLQAVFSDEEEAVEEEGEVAEEEELDISGETTIHDKMRNLVKRLLPTKDEVIDRKLTKEGLSDQDVDQLEQERLLASMIKERDLARSAGTTFRKERKLQKLLKSANTVTLSKATAQELFSTEQKGQAGLKHKLHKLAKKLSPKSKLERDFNRKLKKAEDLKKELGEAQYTAMRNAERRARVEEQAIFEGHVGATREEETRKEVKQMDEESVAEGNGNIEMTDPGMAQDLHQARQSSQSGVEATWQARQASNVAAKAGQSSEMESMTGVEAMVAGKLNAKVSEMDGNIAEFQEMREEDQIMEEATKTEEAAKTVEEEAASKKEARRTQLAEEVEGPIEEAAREQEEMKALAEQAETDAKESAHLQRMNADKMYAQQSLQEQHFADKQTAMAEAMDITGKAKANTTEKTWVTEMYPTDPVKAANQAFMKDVWDQASAANQQAWQDYKTKEKDMAETMGQAESVHKMMTAKAEMQRKASTREELSKLGEYGAWKIQQDEQQTGDNDGDTTGLDKDSFNYEIAAAMHEDTEGPSKVNFEQPKESDDDARMLKNEGEDITSWAENLQHEDE